MNWDACRYYDTKEEMPGGAYWEILNIRETELREKIILDSWTNVIQKIKNKILQERLKEKTKRLFEYSSLYDMDVCLRKGLFTADETKELVLKAIEFVKYNFITCAGNLSTQDGNKKMPIDYRIISIIQLIYDQEWQIDTIRELLDFVNSNGQFLYSEEILREINTYLINNISNNELRKEMIEKYSSRIWEEFKHYNEFINNPYYIFEKSKQYKDVKIGLNPKLQIGLEIELNRNLFKGLLLYKQKGIQLILDFIDVTVPDGTEFDTSIFHDIPLEVSVICALCDTLKEIGYVYDEEKGNASGQINIGIDYLDTVDAILNFFEIYCNCEELLFYISNEEGQLMRMNIYDNKYAKPFSGLIGKIMIDEEITRDDMIRMLTAHDDYYTIERYDEKKEQEYFGDEKTNSRRKIISSVSNYRQEETTLLSIPGFKLKENAVTSLTGLQFKKNSVCLRDGKRLEFRIPNSSVEYKVWIDNIRLYGRLVEVAKEVTDALGREFQTEAELRKITLKEELKDASKTLEEKLFILMDLLFEDDEIKKIYMDRFYTLSNAIRKTNSKMYSMPDGNEVQTFGVVEFQKVYRTRVYENLGPVVIYDPQGETKIENKRNNEINL